MPLLWVGRSWWQEFWDGPQHMEQWKSTVPAVHYALGLAAFTTRAGLTLIEHLSGGVLQVQILVEISF